MAGITAIGSDWEQVERSLRANLSGVAYMSDWDRFEEINTRLGGPVKDFSLPSHYTRKVLRTMGRVSQMSVRSAELAMHDAGLIGDPEIGRSEEHTSELQSLMRISYAVFCLQKTHI